MATSTTLVNLAAIGSTGSTCRKTARPSTTRYGIPAASSAEVNRSVRSRIRSTAPSKIVLARTVFSRAPDLLPEIALVEIYGGLALDVVHDFLRELRLDFLE